MAPRHKASQFLVGAMVLGVFLLLPFLIGQARFSMNPDLFDPDMFTLFGFARYHDAALLPKDYAADYYVSQWMPPGFRLLQWLWAQAFDVRFLHRLLPIVLWFSCLYPVFMCGRTLGGRVNGFATLGIYCCSSIFIFRMVGGMAHGFGFPLVWWGVAAMLGGREVLLAVVTMLAAALYPVISPVLGLMLAFVMMKPAAFNYKRFFSLALVGVITIALMAPMVFSQGNMYGAAINVRTQQDVFPEAAHSLSAINPFVYVITAYVLQNSVRLGLEYGQIFTLGILGLLFSNVLLHDVRDGRPRKLRPYLYIVCVFFLLVFVFAPDHAYRVAIYHFPVLVTLFLPLAFRNLSVFLPRKIRSAGFVGLVLGYIALIGQAELQASGYLFVLEPEERRAVEFIATLPKDVMVAGWPGDRFGKVVEAVPYVAQRSVLVTWVLHPIAHSDYVLKMRERMNALVDAYLARDVRALVQLRDGFGVDYLVVNTHDFEGVTAPSYIEPFTSRAAALWQKNKGHFVVLGLEKKAVYAQDGIFILDLRKL